jgi:hypothetical protein
MFLASYAYACVPQAVVMVGQPGAGVPGDKLGVRGLRFSGTVELRWNAFDGPLLGTVTGPDFTTDITLPDASPGVYVVVALTRIAEGNVSTIAAAPVVVTGNALVSGVTVPAHPAAGTKTGASHAVLVALFAASVLGLATTMALARRARRAGRAGRVRRVRRSDAPVGRQAVGTLSSQ